MRPIPAIDALDDYVLDHSGPVEDAHRNPTQHTLTGGEREPSRIGRGQGAFLTMLTQLTNAERAIEIGTFTGYSALCIARGLPAAGRLLTCDVGHEWSETAGKSWAREGLAGRIEPRLGPAVETLRGLPVESVYDLAFLGADKPAYLDYYEELVPRLRAGGLIVIDEVLLAGTVVTDPDAEEARTMREFNAHVCADQRVDAVMLSIGNGMTLARKRLAGNTT